MFSQYRETTEDNVRLTAEQVAEELNIGLREEYEGLQISADLASLIYERDPVVRRVVNTYGLLMGSAPWQVLSSDSQLAAYCRDALTKIDLINWLGKATVKAAIFTESFLILPEDFEQAPRITGIFDYDYQLRSEPRPRDCFFIRVEAESSLVRFLKFYYPYLNAQSQLYLLSLVIESLHVKDENLAEDLKRIDPSQQALFLQQKIDAIRNGFYNRGTLLTSGSTDIQLLHRKVDGLLSALDALRDAMVSGAHLPYSSVLGSPKLGAGLSSLDRRDNQMVAEQVDSRRTQYWTSIANWFLDRLLLRVGAEPGSATISWEPSLVTSSDEDAEVQERESRTLKNYVEMGAISAEEVRNSKFKGSKVSFGQINLENEKDQPYDLSYLNDSFSGKFSFVEKLWEEYQEVTNMSAADYFNWLQDARHLQSSVDNFWFPLTLKLLSSNFEKFQYSKELQTHALRSIRTLARLQSAPSGITKKGTLLSTRAIALKNWGRDIKEEDTYKVKNILTK